jgi:pilus assembly protein Flp/PilA
MRRRRLADRGATAVEYGLMVAGIAAVILTAVFLFGDVVSATFDRTTSCISLKAPPAC